MVQRACGGAGPVHVIGWSLGGGAGLQLALDRPELVRSLCVFGFTASFCGGESSSAARAAKAVVASPRLVAALGVAGHGMLLALMLRFRAGGPPDRAAARRAIHAANSLVGCASQCCIALRHPPP
jgi:pimeloyl-ACP methyl ester carboxylesterase